MRTVTSCLGAKCGSVIGSTFNIQIWYIVKVGFLYDLLGTQSYCKQVSQNNTKANRVTERLWKEAHTMYNGLIRLVP